MTDPAGVDQQTLDKLAAGRHGDPFAVLGPHATAGGDVVRVLLPGARAVEAIDAAGAATPLVHRGQGLFEGPAPAGRRYRLRVEWPDSVQTTEDAYAFGPQLSDQDLYLFNEGRLFAMAATLGAVPMRVDGICGVRFAVWAPNAQRVAVVGDFNTWDGRRHAMRHRYPSGIWEIFIPGLRPGERYKYEILGSNGEVLPLKADPLARATEHPPATASIVAPPPEFTWADQAWMEQRAARQSREAPISIYEVHLASWMRREDGGALSWDEAAGRLIPYVARMGFTHLELLPVTEHPFGGSWGYQPLGLFAPTARHGDIEGFQRFVAAAHAAHVGIILDWVPAHFPTDPHGLARFDGTALYEHLDPREGFHRDWHTYIYNLARREVQGFLIASALYWLETLHVDGLRVDAVASMLYRDYSRAEGQWIPNLHGGRENLEAVSFLRHLNAVVCERCPGALMIAEESTAWPGVTRAVAEGGLGFSFKWNMGWMNDSLRYMQRNPVHRGFHPGDITFGTSYAFSERFILPLSHDEVVHGKRSLLQKMPGDAWQRRAGLRAYLAFMWAHPGKKLLFMGGELGQREEWSHDAALPWALLEDPDHAGIQRLVGDLNRLYRRHPALHEWDADARGLRWIVDDDRANSVFAFERCAPDDLPILAVMNFTPLPREDYRIGASAPGGWTEILNTDSTHYGGSNQGNAGRLATEPTPSHGQAQSLRLRLPPLATLLLRPAGDRRQADGA